MAWKSPLTKSAWLALICLTFQYSILVLVIHKATSLPPPRFNVSLAVFFSETLKFLISTSVQYLFYAPSSSSFSFIQIGHWIFTSQWYLAWLPALLYTFQNILQYVALTYMDAASYQVTYQLKLVTTALCSVYFLKTTLTSLQWMALGLLTFGIVLVQWPTTANTTRMDKNTVVTFHVSWYGFICVLVSCFLSGFTGVYVEKLLKATHPSQHAPSSLWIKNMQLSFFSMLTAWVWVVCAEPFSSWHQGWTGWAWLAIVSQAWVGLTVALVMKFADNILKGFATTISIILSSAASVYLFHTHLSWLFWIGTATVIFATALYTFHLHAPPPPPRPLSGCLPLSSLGLAHVTNPREKMNSTRFESGVYDL